MLQHDTSNIEREELHFRRIDMRGYRRGDGLYEIVGQVTDQKPFGFTSPSGFKRIPAGEPIHDMTIVLVFDDEMVVRDVRAQVGSAPHGDCFETPPTLGVLIGLRMTSGWNAEVRKRLAGAACCTHLKELLTPMATAAYQALTMARIGRPDVLNSAGIPVKVDSCYSYARSRDVVRRRWPAFYTGPAAAPDPSPSDTLDA